MRSTAVYCQLHPDDTLARLEVVLLPDHPGVQPVAWTRAELAQRRANDPIVQEGYRAPTTSWSWAVSTDC